MQIIRRFIRLLEKTGDYSLIQRGGTNSQKHQYTYLSQQMCTGLGRSKHHLLDLKEYQHARQLMRLGKTVYEFQLIKQMLRSDTKDEFNRMMSVICFAAYGVYWLLDNITIINQYNFINLPTHIIKQYSMTAKFIGSVFALLLDIRNFMRFHYQELKTKERLKTLKDKQNLEADIHRKNIIIKEQKEFYLLLKALGDILPAIAKSVLAKRIFKFEVPRVLQSLGGLVSGVAGCILVDWQ